jgi:hypothetical protein
MNSKIGDVDIKAMVLGEASMKRKQPARRRI